MKHYTSLYRRGKVWWIQYRIGGKNVQRSLETESEQLAKLKLKQIEGLHVSGELGLPRHTPVQSFLEFFCDHLQQRRSKTSYRADISYLRNLFGPLCKALKTKAQIEAEKKGAKTHEAESFPATSMSARRPEDVAPGLVNYSSFEHVQTDRISPKTADRREAEKNDANVCKAVPIPASSMPVRYLEDVTPELVNHFISERIRTDGISPKTANRIRELLHVMFSYAIKQHGFVSPIRGTRNCLLDRALLVGTPRGPSLGFFAELLAEGLCRNVVFPTCRGPVRSNTGN
jgi:hypothetical protein